MKRFRLYTLVVLTLVCGSILTTSLQVYAQEAGSAAITTPTPKSLGPTAMESLVAKMSPEQTRALAGLMELLDESLSVNKTAIPDSQQTMLEVIRQWATGFADASIENTVGLPAAIGEEVALAFGG